MKTQISIKMKAALDVARITVAGILASMAKGIVSFVQNTHSPKTQKGVVRGVSKASRLGTIFQTSIIGGLTESLETS